MGWNVFSSKLLAKSANTLAGNIYLSTCNVPHICSIVRQSVFLRKQLSPRTHGIRSFRSRRSGELGRSIAPSLPSEYVQEPLRAGGLLKPFLFTVGFSAGSFSAVAIWQYESVRSRIRSPVHSFPHVGQWRNTLNRYWNQLSDGQKVFYPICALNCLVFLAWRVPALAPIMMRYFASNPASKSVCLPMVLSTFSHYSFFHLAANMFVLNSFSSGIGTVMGKEQFLGFYLSAGVISSFVSYVHKFAIAQPGLSLGASGAIMGVLGYVCTQMPDSQLAIIFLPMYAFTAGTAIKALLLLDSAGIIFRWKFFDHAAHLGGASFGIAWCHWGHDLIWLNREPLLKWWHSIRTES